MKDLDIKIPVCLHVDHGCTETCKKAIDQYGNPKKPDDADKLVKAI